MVSALLVIRRPRGRIIVILAGTVRLELGPDGVILRWSTEALCAWLCRRGVHRIRDDFMRDRWGCVCGRDWFMREDEREWLRKSRLRVRYQEDHVATLRAQERLRLALSTPDVHRLWRGNLY